MLTLPEQQIALETFQNYPTGVDCNSWGFGLLEYSTHMKFDKGICDKYG